MATRFCVVCEKAIPRPEYMHHTVYNRKVTCGAACGQLYRYRKHGKLDERGRHVPSSTFEKWLVAQW